MAFDRDPFSVDHDRRQLALFATLALAVTLTWSSGGCGGDGSDSSAPSIDDYQVVRIDAGPDLEFRVQDAFIRAQPGTVIELPEGHFEISSQLVLDQSHVVVRGRGMDETILDFAKQESGAEGILARGNAFQIEDVAVVNAPGDCLKIDDVEGVTVRRVKAGWPTASTLNGAYAIYPVGCQNVLIEDSYASGASDTGIYVGQSKNIVVRRNFAELNVAGIEIESSNDADVYENETTRNSGGILIFDLPGLTISGARARVYDNRIHGNNNPNFAPAGNIVGMVPTGTGLMVMANDEVEAFGNEIVDNYTTDVVVASYQVTGLPFDDPDFDPHPQRNDIHDNVTERGTDFFFDGGQLGIFASLLFLFTPERVIPDLVYDGIAENALGVHPLPPDQQNCFHGNTRRDGTPASFGNLNLRPRPGVPLPAGPISTDPAPFDCRQPEIAPARLASLAPIPAGTQGPSDAEIAAACTPIGDAPNFSATEYDCPTLAGYNLFSDASDPYSPPNDGVPFELTTPLFSDYAAKSRVVFLPPGTAATYSNDGTFAFPVGTIIAKTFGFPTDLGGSEDAGNITQVETRLLIHRASGWVGRAYVWDGSIADLALGGGARTVTLPERADGAQRTTTYRIPNALQCNTCHSGGSTADPIGPKARLLNRDHTYADGTTENQLVHWTKMGVLSGAPSDPGQAPRLPVWDDPQDGTLEERARAYLETNCAHCHTETGYARFSGLFLDSHDALGTAYGICKTPVAAGRGAGSFQYDIVPGKPEESILTFRMGSNDPGIKMPELARSVVHDEGVALVTEWIQNLDGSCE